MVQNIDYWFFVRDDNHFKRAVVQAPEMPLEEAKVYFHEQTGKAILDIGYGKEVPKGFRMLPEYQINN